MVWLGTIYMKINYNKKYDFKKQWHCDIVELKKWHKCDELYSSLRVFCPFKSLYNLIFFFFIYILTCYNIHVNQNRQIIKCLNKNDSNKLCFKSKTHYLLQTFPSIIFPSKMLKIINTQVILSIYHLLSNRKINKLSYTM